MRTALLGLLAETPIHPGAGTDTGFVDLPVARESATDYPVIVGSSFKGALRDRYQEFRSAAGEVGDENPESTLPPDEPEQETARIFGRQENAGGLLVSDAKLLLLPVRSLSSQYKWVTCGHLLERLGRDQIRAGLAESMTPVPTPSPKRYFGTGDTTLFLEERQFEPHGPLPGGLLDQLRPLVRHTTTADRLADQLVILNDDDFAWFARFGLSVNARNQLNESTKTSENLWYEETIPPDALFYCLLAERSAGALSAIRSMLDAYPYFQVGGNETVGQGWFAVTWHDVSNGREVRT